MPLAERLLLQAGRLTPAQRSVRDQFERGGSIVAVLTVLLCISAGVVLVYWLTKRQAQAGESAAPADPRQLFNDLLEKLPLSALQRQLLGILAVEAAIEHPSTILLSPALFDQIVKKWQDHRGAEGRTTDLDPALDAALVVETRTVLFRPL